MSSNSNITNHSPWQNARTDLDHWEPNHSDSLSPFSDQDLSGCTTDLLSASSSKPTTLHVHGNKNANERARRNCLNAHLRDLAQCIPALQNVRRPSKTLILERAVGFFDQVQRRVNELERENLLLTQEIDNLKNAIASAIIQNEDPVDSLPSPPFGDSSDSYPQAYSAEPVFTPSSNCNLYATPSPSPDSNFSPHHSLPPTPRVLQEHGEYFSESNETSIGILSESDPIWCQMPFHCVPTDSESFRPVPFQQEMPYPSEETLFEAIKREAIMSMEELSLNEILDGSSHVDQAQSSEHASRMSWR